MHGNIAGRQLYGALEQRQRLLFLGAIDQPAQKSAAAAHDFDMPAAQGGDGKGVFGIVTDGRFQRRLGLRRRVVHPRLDRTDNTRLIAQGHRQPDLAESIMRVGGDRLARQALGPFQAGKTRAIAQHLIRQHGAGRNRQPRRGMGRLACPFRLLIIALGVKGENLVGGRGQG